MQLRRWTPPPMGAIRAFVAAARLLSFTRAADELGVTQTVLPVASRFGIFAEFTVGSPAAIQAS